MNLPSTFAYLAAEPGPKLLLAALADLGLHEVPGVLNSPRILAMARNVGASPYYKSDATPWCALAMADWVKQAGFALPPDPLAAKSWRVWGFPVPLDRVKLADVLVMDRPGGQHVTMYVGETVSHYACIGGNQADSVCIAWFPKTLFTHARRCAWKVAQPANVRRILLNSAGKVVTVSAA